MNPAVCRERAGEQSSGSTWLYRTRKTRPAMDAVWSQGKLTTEHAESTEIALSGMVFGWGAHAPCVLANAPSPSRTSDTDIAARGPQWTREARALPGRKACHREKQSPTRKTAWPLVTRRLSQEANAPVDSRVSGYLLNRPVEILKRLRTCRRAGSDHLRTRNCLRLLSCFGENDDDGAKEEKELHESRLELRTGFLKWPSNAATARKIFEACRRQQKG